MKKMIMGFVLFLILLIPIEVGAYSEKKSEIDTVESLHDYMKKADLIMKSSDGTIQVINESSLENIDESLIKEYYKRLNLLNEHIKEGILSIDQNLNVEPFTVEDIAERVFEADQKSVHIQPYSRAATLHVKSLVELNRKELENVMRTHVTFNPNGAYAYTVGWWVGKVKVNGDWDYKVKSGYSPWNKKFTMHLYNGRVEVHDSKWLGNYNYGYTGQYLFSLPTLYAGGDAVSYLLNWRPDSEETKRVIARGFNDAKKYY